MKAGVELALLYGTVSSWCRQDWQLLGGGASYMGQIQHFLLDFMNDSALVEWARKVPAKFNPYFVGYLAMRAGGHTIPSWEHALAWATAHEVSDRIETLPYRRLELDYLATKAGITPNRPFDRHVYADTTLAKCTNPVYLDDWEAYSVTHTLFYRTDFGVGEFDEPNDRARIVAIVRSLLVRYYRKRNWDLVGELLNNEVGLRDTATPIFVTAARGLFAAQHADGAVPGPNYRRDEAATEAYRFEHCYHTTLVTLWFCAAYGLRDATEARGSETP